MVAQSPPYAEQNAQHSAQLFRLATFSAWRDQSGIVGPTDLAVSAQSTPNMSVQVSAGRAWIRGTQIASVPGGSWSTQGAYYCFNHAPVSLTVAAADPTNPRIDAVVAYVLDSFYSGASNLFVLGVVTGTPANTPTVPAIPSNGLLLGTLAVAANATSIGSGNISGGSSLLALPRGGLLACTSTTRPASPGASQQIYETDTGRIWVWTGTAWKYVGGGPPPTYQCSAPSGWSLVSGYNAQAWVDGSGQCHIKGVISNTTAFTPGGSAALTLPAQVPPPVSGGSFGVLVYDGASGALEWARCQWNSSGQLLVEQGPAIGANSFFYLDGITPWHPTAPGSGVLA